MAETSPGRTPSPPLFSFLAYLAAGFVTLLIPEYSFTDRQVVASLHVNSAFLFRTGVTLVFWLVATYWWIADFRRAQESSSRTLPKDWQLQALAGLALLSALAAWCKPLLSLDTFHYVAYGRQIVVLHINPYQHNLFDSANDPLISQIPHTWFHNIAFYGPLALSLYSVPNLLFGNPTLMQLALFLKFLWIPIYFGYGLALMRYWRSGTDRRVDVLAVLASPVFLWFGLVDGHVDLLLAALLTLTAALQKQDRPVLSALSLAGAASIKIVGIVALPVCFFWWLQRSVRQAAQFSAAFTLVYGGVYAAVKGGEYIGVVEFTKLWNNLSAANLVPRLMSNLPLSLPTVQMLSNLIFYGSVALICALTWKGLYLDNPARPMALVLCALFVTRTYFQPWYALWFWPLLWASTRSSRGFQKQILLWNLVLPATFGVGWSLKGYFLGGVALLAVGLVVMDNPEVTANEE